MSLCKYLFGANSIYSSTLVVLIQWSMELNRIGVEILCSSASRYNCSLQYISMYCVSKIYNKVHFPFSSKTQKMNEAMVRIGNRIMASKPINDWSNNGVVHWRKILLCESQTVVISMFYEFDYKTKANSTNNCKCVCVLLKRLCRRLVYLKSGQIVTSQLHWKPTKRQFHTKQEILLIKILN